jgi:hypothetical protein
MTKKIFWLGVLSIVVVLGVVIFTGCSSTQALTATSVSISETDGVLKTGEASSHCLFGFFYWGNGGIHDAKVAGNITTVSTVDVRTLNLLGGSFYQKKTTIVTGY